MLGLSKFKSNAASRILLALLSESPGDRVLSDFVKAGARPFVMAGAVRDAVAINLTSWPVNSPRDVDIGVAGLRRELFEEIMNTYWAKPNRYGGYRLLYENSLSWDIWRLEETIGLRSSTEVRNVENVLRSFVLDCNTIAYDVLLDRFFDLNARTSIIRGEISLLKNAIFHDEPVFAAKALLFHYTLHMHLTPTLTKFVGVHLTRSSLTHELSKYVAGPGIDTADFLERVAANDSCRLDNQNRRLPPIGKPVLDLLSSLLSKRISDRGLAGVFASSINAENQRYQSEERRHKANSTDDPEDIAALWQVLLLRWAKTRRAPHVRKNSRTS